METLGDRVKLRNSLSCLAHACVGHRTTVELQDDTMVTGVVTSCDAQLNIGMEGEVHVVHKHDHHATEYKEYTIRGSSVRLVQIPDSIDMRTALGEQIDRLSAQRQRVKRDTMTLTSKARHAKTRERRAELAKKQLDRVRRHNEDQRAKRVNK